MMVEETQGQWLMAKARQLKERALGTADRTRRQQFLLIATEYQKLARQEAGAFAPEFVERLDNCTLHFGVVTPLRLASGRPVENKQLPQPGLSHFSRVFRRPEIVNLTIWGILVVISFALLLVPGDQTALGLKALSHWFVD